MAARRSLSMFALGALVLVSGLSAAPARAHLGSISYLGVARTDDGAHVRAQIDAIDVAAALGLGKRHLDDAALAAGAGRVEQWLTTKITLRGRGGPCRGHAGPPAFANVGGRPFVRIDLRYVCPPPVRDVILRDDTIFDGDPRHETIVRVWLDEAHVLRIGNRQLALGAPQSIGALVTAFLAEGIHHLVTGYDHLLFLLSLLLASGFVAERDGLAAAMRDIAFIVTAFTLGHSVTLISAALGIVVLPSRVVESAIAASIVVVALNNLWRPEARRAVPWLAFTFGLVHGFGFSAVLSGLALPPGHAVLALLSFNVGIEVAQLGFVAVVLGPIAWAARWQHYGPVVVRAGSLAIAAVASTWFVERVLGA